MALIVAGASPRKEKNGREFAIVKLYFFFVIRNFWGAQFSQYKRKSEKNLWPQIMKTK